MLIDIYGLETIRFSIRTRHRKQNFNRSSAHVFTSTSADVNTRNSRGLSKLVTYIHTSIVSFRSDYLHVILYLNSPFFMFMFAIYITRNIPKMILRNNLCVLNQGLKSMFAEIRMLYETNRVHFVVYFVQTIALMSKILQQSIYIFTTSFTLTTLHPKKFLILIFEI